uniref:Uncharacterized protein n=1 Tax=viral metagenome TaxID=1070528 RepID=A0A6H2A2Q8_9ZZZZ
MTLDFSEINGIPDKMLSPYKGLKELQTQIMSSLDLDMARMYFKKYKDQIEIMKSAAEAHQVKSETSLKQAIGLAGDAKQLAKRIEQEKKTILEEPNQFVKAVSAFAKDFTAPLQEIEANLKQKIGQYQYRIELDRRKQEELIRKANEELQKKLNKEAKKAGVEAPKVTPTPVVKAETVARSETGASTHIRKAWKAEVCDPEKVPREYCEPSMKLINQAVKMGVREIEGVRIFEDIQTVLRT